MEKKLEAEDINQKPFSERKLATEKLHVIFYFCLLIVLFLNILSVILLYYLSFQSKLLERNAEIKDILENFTNMEKQCEGIGQPVSVDLQVKL